MAKRNSEHENLIEVLIKAAHDSGMRDDLLTNPEEANTKHGLNLSKKYLGKFRLGVDNKYGEIMQDMFDGLDDMIRAWAILQATKADDDDIQSQPNCFPGCGPHLAVSLK